MDSSFTFAFDIAEGGSFSLGANSEMIIQTVNENDSNYQVVWKPMKDSNGLVNRYKFDIVGNSIQGIPVNESGHSYHSPDLVRLFQNRSSVQNEVKKYPNKIKETTWKKIDYYYKLRCSLIHERAGAGINDDQVDDCLNVVLQVLWKLFRLEFDDI